MTACRGCSRYGTFISKVELPQAKRDAVIMEQAPELELVDEYGRLVREAREKAGMSQEDMAKKLCETINVIKKVEQGRMAPTEKLAAKMQALLKIRLFERVKRESVEPQKRAAGGMTLGDIVKIKRG
jgi:putative transcription factor